MYPSWADADRPVRRWFSFMQTQLQSILAAYKKAMPSSLWSSKSGKTSRRVVDLPMVHYLLHLLFPSKLHPAIPEFYSSKALLRFSPIGCGSGTMPRKVDNRNRRKGRWVSRMFWIDKNLRILQEISTFRLNHQKGRKSQKRNCLCMLALKSGK